MDLQFSIDQETYKIEIDFKDGKYLIKLGGRQYNVDSQPISENCLSLLVDGKAYTVFVAEDKTKKYISVQGEQFCVEEAKSEAETRSVAEASTLKGIPTISSPMPGKIVSIKCSKGQAVKRGDVLLILEAMKMEQEIKAKTDGTVLEIKVSVGMTVQKEDILITTG